MDDNNSGGFLWLTIGFCTAIVICALLCGCTRKVYVPVETVRTEYKDRVQLQTRIDSVFERDSVAVLVKGDTVRIEKWRDRVRWREREIHDTLTVVKTDSVAVPYPVERELTKWERTKMDFGGLAIGGVATLAITFIILWLIKRKK